MTTSNSTTTWLLVLLLAVAASAFTAVLPSSSWTLLARSTCSATSQLWSSAGGEDAPDNEGADLAAELFKMAQQKGVGVDAEDLLDDEEEEEEDDEEDDDDDDEEVPNYPQGAINAFLGYDTGDVGEKLSGNVSLTDSQLYSEVKERVLDTAGGFVDFVQGASDEEDDEVEDDQAPKEYQPPTTVPDPELTAGEVVLTVLEALNNNDKPEPNRGVEVFFGFSSPSSSVRQEKGLTPAEYAEFLKETEYKVLFDHQEVVSFAAS
jgi:hypothetical protein